jgi:hypothetical protein
MVSRADRVKEAAPKDRRIVAVRGLPLLRTGLKGSNRVIDEAGSSLS